MMYYNNDNNNNVYCLYETINIIIIIHVAGQINWH